MQHTLSNLIRRHPFLSFIFIAFAFIWAFWLLLPAESPGEVPVQFLVGAFGPAVGAIIVSGGLNPRAVGVPKQRRWTVFGVMLIAGAFVIWLSRDVLFEGNYVAVWIISAAILIGLWSRG